MSKQRVALRINEDEAAVVGPVERWKYLISVFEILAEDQPEYADGWRETANWVRGWIEETGSENEWPD